jgi:hypothetical protein
MDLEVLILWMRILILLSIETMLIISLNKEGSWKREVGSCAG